MKNLTHYFKNNATSPSSTAEVSAPQSSNNSLDLEDKNEETTKNSRRAKQKRKKRKVSDPAVESLSTNLSVVSPVKPVKKGLLRERILNTSADDFESVSDCNKSVIKEKKACKVAENATTSEAIVVTEEQIINFEDTNVELKEKSPSTPKRNAFQFMMESRTKSIGRNSPGKEKQTEHDDGSKSAKKERLSARKNLLQNWADKKGGLKRKRAEEEAEEAIKTKLKKRADRLKNLLSGEKEEKKDVIKIKMFSPQKNVAKESGRKKKTRLSLSKEKVGDETETEMKVSKRKKKKTRLSLSKEKGEEITKRGTEEEETITIDDEDSKKTKTESEEDDLKETIIKIDDEDREREKTKAGAENNDLKEETIINIDAKDCEKEKTKAGTENNDLKEETIKTDDEGCKRTKTNPEETNLIEEIIKIDDEKTKGGTEKNDLKAETIKKDNEDCKKTKTGPEENDSKEETIKIDDEDCEPQENDLKQKSPCKKSCKLRIKVTADVTNDNQTNSPPLRRSSRTKKPTKRCPDIVYIERESSPEILCVDETGDSKKSKVKKAEERGKREEIKKPVKLAPIFVKKTRKPAVDPKVEEAKRIFLRSGLPEVLKKAIDKQKIMEAKEFEVFPEISHIQQKTTTSSYWQLPSVNFTFRQQESPVKTTKNFTLNPLPCVKTLETNIQLETTTTKPFNMRLILKEIKSDYPEFPVYKTFRLLREKSCKLQQPIKKSKKRKLAIEPPPPQEDFSVWTEKYKPQTTEEILGNTVAVRELKNWLKSWVELSKEITAKRKRNNSSSSEFDTSDGDSRDSMGLPRNTVIVAGPVASGKTMAVYAVANELEINVLELNASSKRTGKRLLQELQEATQSHQVRKNSNLFEMCKQKNEKTDQTNTKMCLLLVEDVDIVFEQDEGFLYSLNQLLSTSKRPVVLVTSDLHSENLMKFTNQYKVINFNKVGVKILTAWLQLICLLEGLYLTKNCIQELLQHNKSDVRKTLLQLQIFVQTAGEKHKNTIESADVFTIEDEDEDVLTNLKEENTESDCGAKENCLKSFLFNCNETLWWNLPQLLNVQTSDHKKSLKAAARLLETQSFLDLYDGVLKIECSGENVIKDSLELTEDYQDCKNDQWLVEEIKGSVLESCLGVYRKNTEKEEVVFNFGLPNTVQRRWSKTQQNCDESLCEILPFSVRTDRKSVSLDYLATLRDISRLEMGRQAVNNKRGNRFYNYLQGLGVDCNESVLKTACEMFL